jgi:hypothetical protein
MEVNPSLKVKAHRKGVQAIPFIIGTIIGLLLLLILGTMTAQAIQKSGEAASGCTNLASVIADMTGGKLELC